MMISVAPPLNDAFCIFLLLLIITASMKWVRADFDLLLLHTNDMHARFEQADVYGTPCTDQLAAHNKCYGGFPRLKRAVDEARAEAKGQNVSSIFLNAGDTFQGTPYYSILKWPVVAAFIDTIGIDVMSLGNHEFDDGVESLTAFLNNISLPVVASNLNLTFEPKMAEITNLIPSVTLKVGSKRIGIIGYITPETKTSSKSGSVIFLDEIESLKAEVDRIKRYTDIIIALGHSGFQRDLEIAKQVPGISLVVGGHSHSLLYTPKDKPPSVEKAVAEYPVIVTQDSGRKVAVVQAYCNTKYLGKLRVKFSDNGDLISAKGDPILLTGQMKQDDKLLKEVMEFKLKIHNITSEVAGKTKVFLSMHPTESNEFETNMGNLIADSMVDYVTRKFNASSDTEKWTDASIAVVQGGGIRTNLDNKKNDGILTFGDLLTVMPFENELYTVEFKGGTLLQILEYSAHRITPNKYRDTITSEFLQVSGLKVTYDASKDVGQKVKSAYARCSQCQVPEYFEIQPNSNYTVVINSYMLGGGDGYAIVKTYGKNPRLVGTTDTNALKEYIKNRDIIYPEVEGRVRVENIISKSSSSTITTSSFLTVVFAFLFVIPTYFPSQIIRY